MALSGGRRSDSWEDRYDKLWGSKTKKKKLKKVKERKAKMKKTNKIDRKKAKNSDLDTSTKKNNAGVLVFAVIGNYKGLGKKRVILHEATLEPTGTYSYGDKRTWVFPTR